jgi:hypothetical protein
MVLGFSFFLSNRFYLLKLGRLGCILDIRL